MAAIVAKVREAAPAADKNHPSPLPPRNVFPSMSTHLRRQELPSPPDEFPAILPSITVRLKGGKKFFEYFEAFRGEHQHLHLIRERPEGETEDGTGDHVPKGGPA